MPSEYAVARNRRIAGTLLAVSRADPDSYDYDFYTFFADRVEDFVRTRPAAQFTLILAAKLVGDAARRDRKIEGFVAFELPVAAEFDPAITTAYRLTVAAMNEDTKAVAALAEIATQERQRSVDVLACVLGMLAATPPSHA